MTKHSCKVCGSRDLHKAIDLGRMPSANNLVTKALLNKVKSYSTAYYWCGNCTLLQQVEFAPRSDLFNKDYPYLTGVNTPSVEDFKSFSISIRGMLPKRDFGVVIASNDGTEIRILQEFGGFGKVIGVDPAENLARLANERGLFTINEFFGYELSKRIVSEYGKADFVVAKGVFAHIPDPRDMLMGMKNLVSEDGIIAIEVHYLRSLIESMMIDTLYAEHYFEWSVKAMRHLANSIGLKVAGVEYLAKMRGGSLRFLIRKDGSERAAERLIEEEDRAGLSSLKTIEGMQDRADERKRRLTSLIKRLKSEKKRISVWTASAKVPTLLNFCGLSNKELDYAYDITEQKIGKFIPKVGIEIRREDLAEKDMPDYLIIGSWNYIDVALKKFAGYMRKGGKLINPLTNEIISAGSLRRRGSDGRAATSAKELITEGKRVYDSLMRGERHRINGIRVVSSQKVGHLYLQEIHYRVEDIEGYWTKVSSHGEKTPGATVVPVLKEDGKEYIVLLFKPLPVMATWGIGLPSGAMKGTETPEECAARELEEETGLKAGRLTWLMSQCNFPDRIVNTDQVYIAENLSMGKREGDKEEKPMKVMALTIPEVARLLDKNKIQGAMITAVLTTYLLKKNPLLKERFNALKRNRMTKNRN